MTDKKNIVLTVLLFILFFLIFPLKLNPNLRYKSSAANDLSTPSGKITGDKLPYIYGKTAGYFSSDLKESWSINIIDGITLLSDRYINHSLNSRSIDIVSLGGEVEFSVKDDGYPFSLDNRLFIIGKNRKRLSEVVSGANNWTHSFNHIITSIDANKDSIVVGFDKGNFIVINNRGEIFFNYEPGGSKISIVYSVSISEDGNYIAAVSGLDPQRFIIYEKKDNEYKPVNVFNLNEDVKRSLNLFITKGNKKVFLERTNGFYIVDIASKEQEYVEDKYNLVNVEYLSDLDAYLVHTGISNYNRIKVISDDNRVLLSRTFISEEVTVTSKNNSLYIVLDNSVVKLDIESEK